MIAAGGDIKDGKEGCRLTGAGQHGGGAALQLADLGRHRIAGGILQSGIKIAAGLQIEKLAHIITAGIFKGGALNNGDLAGFAVSGGITALHTFGFDLKITHFSILL